MEFESSGPIPVTLSESEARVWSCDFLSPALGKAMTFRVVLPAGMKPTTVVPAVYLLHGRGRHENTLLDSPAIRARLLASPVAIILPRGEDGWYVNSPLRLEDRYADYLDEVISLAETHFPLSSEARHRGIAGWSMGGYGAVMTAIRHPGKFAALGSMIGLLNFPRLPIAEADQNYEVPFDRFGSDPELWPPFNPRFHVEKLRGIQLFQVIGEQAFDRQMNESFRQAMESINPNAQVLRLPGGHVWPTVEAALFPLMDFLETRLRC